MQQFTRSLKGNGAKVQKKMHSSIAVEHKEKIWITRVVFTELDYSELKIVQREGS